MSYDRSLRDLLDFGPPPTKRRVFVSYCHKDDQYWADTLRTTFGSQLDVFTDRSLDEPVRSDDPEYVNRQIRETFIVGSSVTILLCGARTWGRKYVDWEIRSTLQHRHGLLGIGLPSVALLPSGSARVPNRYLTNYQRGYTPWTGWPQSPTDLISAIEEAVRRAAITVPDNSLPKMARNQN